MVKYCFAAFEEELQAEIQPQVTQGLFSELSILSPGLLAGPKKTKRERKTPERDLPSFADQLYSQKRLLLVRTLICKRRHTGSQNRDPLSALTFCSPCQSCRDFSSLLVTPATTGSNLSQNLQALPSKGSEDRCWLGSGAGAAHPGLAIPLKTQEKGRKKDSRSTRRYGN